jgi:gas vesicle protein
MNSGGYNYLNYRKSKYLSNNNIIDGEIYSNMKLMNDKRESWDKILSRKRDKVVQKIADMDMHKEKVFDDMEKFFNQIIEKAKARCK